MTPKSTNSSRGVKIARAQTFADHLEEQLPHNATVTVDEYEDRTELDVQVFVSMETHNYLDLACTIAYDHGFVPNGITELPATRFKLREDSEWDIND